MRFYPHELSGGMLQRAMIAMAIICRPSLLIADEPTTALDVTIAQQILRLLRRLQREQGFGVFFISHDLDLVERLLRSDRGSLRRSRGRDGRGRGAAPTAPAPVHAGAPRGAARPGRAGRTATDRARHGAHGARRCAGLPVRSALPARDRPVPRGASRARRGRLGPHRRLPSERCPVSTALLELREVVKVYPVHGSGRKRASIRAVDGVDLAIPAGRVFGLVGESGSGKTTVARCILGLHAALGGLDRVRRDRSQRGRPQRQTGPAPGHPARLPAAGGGTRPAPDRRPPDLRAADDPPARPGGRAPGSASRACSRTSASCRSIFGAIRTSSRAGSASAS